MIKHDTGIELKTYCLLLSKKILRLAHEYYEPRKTVALRQRKIKTTVINNDNGMCAFVKRLELHKDKGLQRGGIKK
jgi:hypothetical protein